MTVKLDLRKYEAARKFVLDWVSGMKEAFSWGKDVIRKMPKEHVEKVERKLIELKKRL
tara:strand:- start:818 stop:991 length:174 start_codon:yes stop_codon:yes gene_type:complete